LSGREVGVRTASHYGEIGFEIKTQFQARFIAKAMKERKREGAIKNLSK